jgi:hypothetical protein
MRAIEQLLAGTIDYLVFRISDTELGKMAAKTVLTDGLTGEEITLPHLRSFQEEVELLKFANSINDLMPKFIRTDMWYDDNCQGREMIVMENLERVPKERFTLAQRVAMFNEFEEGIIQLHNEQFVHGELMRDPLLYGNGADLEPLFRMIVQTENGLRLVDAGHCMRFGNEKALDRIKAKQAERQNLTQFRKYYLSGE